MGPPDNELGVSVGIRLVLVRRDDLAVALVDLVAYSSGVGGRVSVRRKGPHDGPPFMHPMHQMGGRGLGAGNELPPELLRFGVEYSDGRRATTLERPHRPGEEPDIVLLRRGGGGGNGSYEFGFWLWPLPPVGPITFAAEWPASGVELTKADVDAAPILEAAPRSEKLWEDDGSGDSGSGWFSSGSSSIVLRPKPGSSADS